jgi:hypothetical protein
MAEAGAEGTEESKKETGSGRKAAIRGNLVELGEDLYIKKVKIDDLKEAELNAHVMPSRMFERLAENIRERGALESVPYCSQPNLTGPIIIISGNHRVRAAGTAELTDIWLLIDAKEHPRGMVVAKQLAHNQLVGADDPDLVRALLAKIETPEHLLHSGVDEEMLGDVLAPRGVEPFTPELNLDWRTISFTFLPHQLDQMDELFESLQGTQDVLVVALKDQWPEFLKAASAYARLKNVKAGGAIVDMMVKASLAELGKVVAPAMEKQPENWIRISEVIGSDKVPEDVAKVIRQAIAKMRKDGDVGEKNEWQALEYWAADYLAGPNIITSDEAEAESESEAQTEGGED